nr:FxsA family protein [Corynebacterium lactis]
MSRLLPIIYLAVEIAAFIALGRWIGFGWAVLVVAALFVLGVVFAAVEFKRIYQKWLRDTSATLTQFGQSDPEEALKRSATGAGSFFVDSAILLVGSILLALPGVVTTFAGFLMVLPPVRWAIRKSGSATLLGWFQKQGTRSMTVVSQYGTSGAGMQGFPGFGGFDASSFPSDRVVPPAPDNAWDDQPGSAGSESGKNDQGKND